MLDARSQLSASRGVESSDDRTAAELIARLEVATDARTMRKALLAALAALDD